MTMKRIAAVVVLALSSVIAAQAQMGGMGGAPAAAPGTPVDPAKSFDAAVIRYRTQLDGRGPGNARG